MFNNAEFITHSNYNFYICVCINVKKLCLIVALLLYKLGFFSRHFLIEKSSRGRIKPLRGPDPARGP